MDLFEDNFGNTAIATFGFDNAPSHQKRALDALSACHMPKSTKIWNRKEGVRMHDGCLPNNQPQSFYFPEDHPTNLNHFKGMRVILEECGFTNVAKLPVQCGKAFNCKDTSPNASCCCCWILFNQKDFLEQKSALVELVERCGHTAFFYPKFHCELNFIEQNWGSAKSQYGILPLTQNEVQMEQNIRESLDKVDILKMCRSVTHQVLLSIH